MDVFVVFDDHELIAIFRYRSDAEAFIEQNPECGLKVRVSGSTVEFDRPGAHKDHPLAKTGHRASHSI